MRKTTTRKVATVLLATTVAANGFSVSALAETAAVPEAPAESTEFSSENEISTIREASGSEAVRTVIDALGGDSVAEFENGTLRLKADAYPTQSITITGASGITGIDLGEYKIEGSKCVLNFKENAAVTISGNGKIVETGHERGINVTGNSVVTMTGGTVETNAQKGYAIYMQDNGTFILDGGHVTAGESCYAVTLYGVNAHLQVKSGSVTAYNFAVTGNGSKDIRTRIEITGGEITSTNDVAIYHPQSGEMTISGGSITGVAGIVARAGKITILDGANITATGHGTIQPGTTEDSIPDAAVAGDIIPGSNYMSDTLQITILGGDVKAADGEPAVSLTENGTEKEEVDHDVFDVKGGHFTNPGDNFRKYVDEKSVAAKKGEDSNETVVGSDIKSVADELGVVPGDTLVVEKAPEGASADGLESGVHVKNESGNNITVNDTELADQQETDVAKADTKALEAAIADAESRKAGDYSKESWDKMQEALKAAKDLLAQNPAADRQAEADAAAKTLTDAIQGLAKAEQEKADYSKYNEALAAAKAAKRSDYRVSDEVWNAFQKAIDDIDKALAKDLDRADQQKVDDAVKAIEAEVAKLGNKVSGSTGTSGGYSGGSYNSSYSGTPTYGTAIPKGSVAGVWTYNAARDKWTFNNYQYRRQWVYAYNGYANASQNAADWFYFDGNGEMVTGWFTDRDGYVYYLNPLSDNTRGRMFSGWNWITGEDGKQRCYYFNEVHDGHFGGLVRNTVTPDGYTVDASGAWTVNGIVAVR